MNKLKNMKILIIVSLVLSFSFNTFAKDRVSDLFYVPSRGQVAGISSIERTYLDISGVLGLQNYALETENYALNQTIAVGVSDHIALSIKLPFVFGGTITERSSGTQTEANVNSDLGRSVIGATFHHNIGSDIKGFFTLTYQEEDDAAAPSSFGIAAAVRYTKLGNSFLFNFAYTNLDETSAVEEVDGFGTTITWQYNFDSGLFTRTLLSISYESDTILKTTPNIEFSYDTRFQGGLSLGYEFEDTNLYILGSLLFGRASSDITIASIESSDADSINNSFGLEVGYIF